MLKSIASTALLCISASAFAASYQSCPKASDIKLSNGYYVAPEGWKIAYPFQGNAAENWEGGLLAIFRRHSTRSRQLLVHNRN